MTTHSCPACGRNWKPLGGILQYAAPQGSNPAGFEPMTRAQCGPKGVLRAIRPSDIPHLPLHEGPEHSGYTLCGTIAAKKLFTPIAAAAS